MKSRMWAAALVLAMLAACGGGGGGSGEGPVPPTGGEAPNDGGGQGGNPDGGQDGDQPDAGGDADGGGSDQPVPVPTAHGEAVGSAVSAEIGPDGGTLSSADGDLTIVVPAGAFASAQTVSIQEVTNLAHGGKGRAYRLRPEGLNTPVPMTVRLRYDDELLAGTALPHLGIAYQDEAGVWRRYAVPAVDTAAHTLSVPTTHFSDWSRVAGLQLLPHRATLQPGQSLALSVSQCVQYDPETSEDPWTIPPAPYACSVVPAGGPTTSQWSVNGVLGGGGVIGTVVPDAGPASATATYTAPATKPEPNTVAVSTMHKAGKAVELLVSQVTIEALPADCEGYRTVREFKVDLSFDSFFHTGAADYLTHTGTHAGRLVGRIQRMADTGAEGYWMGYVHGEGAGLISIADSYAYNPPGGPSLNGTIEGNSAPVDSLNTPSIVRMRLNFATCKLELFGGYTIVARVVENGQGRDQTVQIGALYLFNQIVPAAQRGRLVMEGTLPVRAQTATDVTGYVPTAVRGANWVREGRTTARWAIQTAP